MEIVQTSIVVLGEGFTPQMVRGKALVSVFGDEPTNSLATPVLGTAQFADGLSLTVQLDRMDVRQQRAREFSERLRDAAENCLRLWPLLEIKAVGLNIMVAEPFVGSFDVRGAFDYIDRERVESLLGAPLVGQRHVFTVETQGARVTLQLSHGEIAGKEDGLIMDVNVHFETFTEIRAVLDSGTQWLERAEEWMKSFAANR